MLVVENNWLLRQKWVPSRLESKQTLTIYNVLDEQWIQILLKDDFYLQSYIFCTVTQYWSFHMKIPHKCKNISSNYIII